MVCVMCISAWMAILVIALTAVLWKTSQVARYWLKWFVFGVASTIFATAPIPLMLWRPRDSKNALIPAKGLRFNSMLLGLNTSVDGYENIVKDSGCVVLINHQSMLDLIVLAELWPIMDNCTVISKKEILYMQPFGTASWLWGTIFIDRVRKDKAQEAINQRGQTIRNNKNRVLMFPEGTRNDKEKLLPFKKGAFHLAIAAGCPIQPVAVSRYRFLGKYRFDSGNIKIRILPAISTEGMTKDDLPELIDKCYEVLSQGVDKLTKENDETPPLLTRNGTRKIKEN